MMIPHKEFWSLLNTRVGESTLHSYLHVFSYILMQFVVYVFVFGVIFLHSLRYLTTCLNVDRYDGAAYSLKNAFPLFVYNITNQTRTIL